MVGAFHVWPKIYFLQFEASIDQKDTLVMRIALPNNKSGIRFFNLIVSFM
jgi:hypothetical protein